MNRKILVIVVSLLVMTMLAVPVMAAKPTETPITYFREVEIVYPYEYFMAGEKGQVMIITNSTRSGYIYEGTDNTGTKLFDFTQYGSAEMNLKQGKAIWHFYHVWTKPTDPNSGFKGVLNGASFSPAIGAYTVSGVLQGYGEYAGQELKVELVRTPPNAALVTGFLYA